MFRHYPRAVILIGDVKRKNEWKKLVWAGIDLKCISLLPVPYKDKDFRAAAQGPQFKRSPQSNISNIKSKFYEKFLLIL